MTLSGSGDLRRVVADVRARVDSLGALVDGTRWSVPPVGPVVARKSLVAAATSMVQTGEVRAALFGLADGPVSFVRPEAVSAVSPSRLAAVLDAVPVGTVIALTIDQAEIRAIAVDGVRLCLELAPGTSGPVDPVLAAALDGGEPVGEAAG